VIKIASLAFTFAAGSEAGASIRAIAAAIEKAATSVSDRNSSGASVTLTLDNAPSSGVCSVLIAGGGLPTQTTFLA
jgi:hypothetical protein